MKNYLKQFAESAIRYRRRIRYDWLLLVRIKLFFYFIVSTLFVFTAVHEVVNPATAKFIAVVFNLATPETLTYVRANSLFFDNFGVSAIYFQVIVGICFILGALTSTWFAMRTIVRGHNDQRRFASVVAHELRTPLSVLKATAEISQMRGKDITPEEVESLLKSVISEVDRMSQIIRFFLRFSLRDKSMSLPMSPLNLVDVIDASFTLVSHDMENKGLSSIFLNRGSSYIVWGNPVAIEDLFVNLFRNAIKHTPRGGSVRVDLHTKGPDVECMITDTGSGIAPDDLPHIFEPFYKSNLVENSTNGGGRNGNGNGIGLGLAIVKDIAKMHNISIDVKSEVGKGTTFTLLFPHA